jgi:hypothetical protein
MADVNKQIYLIGRTWYEAPHAWKNFVRSLPTFTMLSSATATSEQRGKMHSACIRRTLKQYDARYYSSSRKHAARIVFDSAEGRCAWELAYA